MALHRIVTMASHTAEPHAVNHELLVMAIEDERKWIEELHREQGLDGGTIQWDPIDLAKTDSVVLSYSRVKTITGLSTLKSLVKLRLDNNEIEHITGLGALANLRELDLSMNRIKQITGLAGLRKLTDLSLYCNQLSVIEGLDDQKDSLEVLSVGRNQIADQSSVAYLRPFSRLRIVCLEHNPVSQEGSEYRGSTIALLPHIRYLDWVAVGPGERRQASEAFHRLITEADDVQGGAAGGAVTAVAGRAAAASPSIGGGPAVAADRDADEAGLFFVTNLWRLMTEASGGTELAGGALGHVSDEGAESKHEGGGGGGGMGPKAGEGRSSVANAPSAHAGTLLRVPGVADRMEAYREAVAQHIEQVVGRGLATHAEIERETIAADFVRGSYEEASDAEAKSLVAAYARLRKMIVRQVEGKAEAAPAVAASASAVQLKQHQQSTGDLRSGGGGDPALDSAAAADSDVPGSGVGDAGDMSASHLGAKAPGAGGDAASVSSESEAAAIESSIRSLEQLAVENDTLRGKLLAIETTLHEQVITVITEFDAAYAEVGAKRAEAFNKFFRAVEKEELAVNEDLKALVSSEVERYAEQAAAAAAGGAAAGAVAASFKARGSRAAGASAARDGKLDEEDEDGDEDGDMEGSEDEGGDGRRRDGDVDGVAADEDVVALLSDREASAAVVSGSHDVRMTRLLATEDKTRVLERERERRTVKARTVAACDRHRLRVAEINALHAHNAREIGEWLKAEHAALAELQDN